MKFTETKIAGAWIVDLNLLGDERGVFSRAWCRKEFKDHDISMEISQANLSFSQHKGTIRGMHFQREPYAEIKVIRCARGGVFDVVLDLRPDSPTYCQWHGEELSAENRRMLVVPKGCAHGFQTMTDDTEVFYLVSSAYSAESEGGARWDDPAFGIDWPIQVSKVSEKDATFPDFKDK